MLLGVEDALVPPNDITLAFSPTGHRHFCMRDIFCLDIFHDGLSIVSISSNRNVAPLFCHKGISNKERTVKPLTSHHHHLIQLVVLRMQADALTIHRPVQIP